MASRVVSETFELGNRLMALVRRGFTGRLVIHWKDGVPRSIETTEVEQLDASRLTERGGE